MKSYNSIGTSTQGQVHTIEIRKIAVKNAITYEDGIELGQALMHAATDDDIRVVILTGQQGFFCSGLDLSNASSAAALRPEDVLNSSYAVAIKAITTIEKPVIAVVEGYAAGIGMSLALACDLMVMGQSAQLYSPFALISFIPDGGSSLFLRERLGYKRAYEFFAESQKLSATECLDMGLTNRVIADDQVQIQAQEWAQELAKKAPLSLAYTKRLMHRHGSLFDIIAQEGEYQTRCQKSKDAGEGIMAFFEKRQAVFHGE